MISPVTGQHLQLKTGSILGEVLHGNHGNTTFTEIVSSTCVYTLCSGISLVSCWPSARAVHRVQNLAVLVKL